MMDNILWATIGAGFLLTIAYVRSELRAHRARRVLECERMTRQRLLWRSNN